MLLNKETRRTQSYVFTMTNEGDVSDAAENVVSAKILWTGLDTLDGISLMDRDLDDTTTKLAWIKK